MIFLLHTLIEGIAGILFLFYPEANNIVPGFGSGEGESFDLLMQMYGLAALLLAALSLIAYFNRNNRVLVLTISGTLAVFHLGMTIVQAFGNPDPRAMLLHFLLMIFLGARYVQHKKLAWADENK